ncbi:uncharacterized protein LOC117887790 isoform X2 [Trachemys scripta elegans]|uniref:uncharacterized protein LOC117887790 isoform X2 n=1 Tax=Trachemys scripta elegans TaxID=31138 RepID=UPI001552E1BE|nr:uncharacterized protein LOC117887790 isoform X2 [Trachemys scripta elegans]
MAGREKAGQMKPKESPEKKVRTNLLQHMLSRRAPPAKEDTKSLLHRLVFLAKISPELADKRDLAGYWHRLFLSLQRYYQGEGVTGLLLLYPTYVVHTLEASSEVLYSILRDLRDMQPQQHSSGATRCWLCPAGTWAMTPRARSQLRPSLSPPNLPDAVLEEVPNLIVPQDTICHLLECRELLSPAQFLQAYDSPLNVVMDSGHVFGSDNPYAVARVATAWEGEAGRRELVNGKESGPMDAWGTAEIGGLWAAAQALLRPTAGHAVLRVWLISAHDRGKHPRAAWESGWRSLRLTRRITGSDGQMGLIVIIWGLTSHWLPACDTRTELTELRSCSVCVCYMLFFPQDPCLIRGTGCPGLAEYGSFPTFLFVLLLQCMGWHYLYPPSKLCFEARLLTASQAGLGHPCRA